MHCRIFPVRVWPDIVDRPVAVGACQSALTYSRRNGLRFRPLGRCFCGFNKDNFVVSSCEPKVQGREMQIGAGADIPGRKQRVGRHNKFLHDFVDFTINLFGFLRVSAVSGFGISSAMRKLWPFRIVKKAGRKEDRKTSLASVPPGRRHSVE